MDWDAQSFCEFHRAPHCPSAQVLSCPIAIVAITKETLFCRFLAGAGVGRLGVVDHDAVDVSNLHRQIAHSEARVGVNKAVSARDAGVYVPNRAHRAHRAHRVHRVFSLNRVLSEEGTGFITLIFFMLGFRTAALSLNSAIICVAHECQFSASNGLDLVMSFIVSFYLNWWFCSNPVACFTPKTGGKPALHGRVAL